jgi:hypothetical protein
LDLSTKEGDEFQEAEYDARLNQQIEFELVRRLEVSENQDLYKWANVFGTFSTSVKLAISVAASTVLPAGIVSFFIMGVLTSIASRRLQRLEKASLGVLQPTLTVFGALTFTVVVFGLFPAGIANVEHVGKITNILIQVAIPVLLMFVIFDRLQKRNFRFGIPETMVFILLVAVVLKLSLSAQQIVDRIPTLSFHVPPRFWNYHPEELINTPTGYDLGPLDVAYQWIAYGGPYLSMACWLSLIMISALWMFIRQKICKKPVPSQSLRSLLAALMQSMTRVCFATSAVLLIAYLVVAPAHILSIERSYQREVALFRDPNKYWSQITKFVDEIRSDGAFMNNASAHVKAEMGI